MTKASDNEFPSVLFDEQGSDPSTPASGFWRAYFKSTGLFVIDDAAVVTGPLGAGGGGGNAGQLIGATRYHNGTDTATYTRTNATQADVDATNAIVTFTAPASGNVIVTMACLTGEAGGGNGHFGIREGSTDLAGPSAVKVTDAWIGMLSRSWRITGVGAGFHTYKAAFSATSSGTITLYTGPTYGDIELTVWAAP